MANKKGISSLQDTVVKTEGMSGIKNANGNNTVLSWKQGLPAFLLTTGATKSFCILVIKNYIQESREAFTKGYHHKSWKLPKPPSPGREPHVLLTHTARQAKSKFRGSEALKNPKNGKLNQKYTAQTKSTKFLKEHKP